MYSILIKDSEDSTKYSFYRTKQEDKKIEYEEVVNEETGEVTTVKKEIGLGTYSTKNYSESDPKKFEATCISLLDKYTLGSLVFVEILDPEVDLKWALDDEQE